LRRPAIRILVLGVMAVALALTPMAAAQQPARSSLPDIEDEVMCPICGTLLELSFSPQAERERDFIRRLIAGGETKGQIKSALVDQYGSDVLATPGGSGFDLTAWVVPGVGLVALASLLGVGYWRRKRGSPAADRTEEPPLSPEDAARLDRDISTYEL
jgi:cytochrome c-type biogenesis protein CcmH/NrfF